MRGHQPFRFRPRFKHPFGKSSRGHIYFIQQGKDGPIKIGFSRDPTDRLRTLQTAHTERLYLLLSRVGTGSDERKLHQRFRKLRITGEWYEPGEALLKFIAEIKRDEIVHKDADAPAVPRRG